MPKNGAYTRYAQECTCQVQTGAIRFSPVMSNTRLTVSIPKATYRNIQAASRGAMMKPAEVIRQSIRLGLPQFVGAFPQPAKSANSALAPAGN